MTIRHWDPLRDLLMLQERLNRLFEEGLRTRSQAGAPALDRRSWSPLADVCETPEAFVLTVDLPGLSEDDVEVQVDGSELTLRGRRHPHGPVAESYHRMERTFGSFSRTFQLSCEVDPDRVSALFRDGLLRIELNKIAPRIPVPVRLRTEGRR